MKIIYLIPEGGYSTPLRSDTLWGMLCWGIRHLYGAAELGAFIQRSKDGKPDFVVSSTFPFKQYGRERIPFFPNPFRLDESSNEVDTATALENYRLRKKLKKVEWLGLEDFELALKGEFSASNLLERLRSEAELKKLANEDGIEFIPSGQTARRTAPKLEEISPTHNTINRLRGGTLNIETDREEAGQLFQAEEFYWTDPFDYSVNAESNTGLFFLADGPNTEKLKPILNLFKHWGFGADRTAGKGFFDFEIDDFKLAEPTADQSTALLNLSLFQPTRDELTALESADGCWQYLLERREGFVGGYRERRMKEPRLYFKEGSVFARPNGLRGRFMGAIRQQFFDAEHTPPHDVWDNGFGFMVNLNWKK